MTNVAIVHTDLLESALAGQTLGLEIERRLPTAPDVVLLFASPHYNHQELLRVLKRTCQPRLIVGCSSAGEFTSTIQGTGMACAVALQSNDMHFSLACGHGLAQNTKRAAQEIVEAFHGMSEKTYLYRTALVFIDALNGCADTLIDHLTKLTHGTYQFFGGGAGDNARFAQTTVFVDTEVVSDAAVALEVLSQKPLGIGAAHSWRPNSEAMRVTKATGMLLETLDNRPAVEAFQLYALKTFQDFDTQAPLPFFLLNIIGIEVSAGYHILRVPTAVLPDGSIQCAAEVPTNSVIRFMSASGSTAAAAPREATQTALRHLYGCEPAFALFFDCVVTRLRLENAFQQELAALAQTLGDAPYVGCNTHGQVIRYGGQYSGFQNSTAVVCIFPK